MIRHAGNIAQGILLSICFWFSGPLVAQEEDADRTAEQQGVADPAPAVAADDMAAAAQVVEPREERPQTIDDLDSFVPSEKVSSDLSISYPVDI